MSKAVSTAIIYSKAIKSKAGGPVTVVARGEFTVVHQNMHRFKRKACEAESTKNICSAEGLGQFLQKLSEG